MTKTYYDAIINGTKSLTGVTLSTLESLKQKGHKVVITDKYNSSEDDYNSIAINKKEW